MILAIAWKNVWRNKLRSLIVIASITVGLIGGSFYLAFTKGMVQSQVERAINSEVSHIQIHNPSFLINDEIKYYIKNTSSIINRISELQQVKSITSRLRINAMVSSASTGTGISLVGIIPEKEKIVTNLITKIKDGTYFETKLRNPIFIGEKLAEKLRVKVGSRIVLTIQNMNNTITYGAFKVVGIFKTENTAFDQLNAFVKWEDLADLINYKINDATEIAILLNHNDQTDTVTALLKDIFSNEIDENKLTVRSWKEIQPVLEMLNNMTIQFTMIFVVIILVALSFGIINTMLMAIMERVREIGMLMAIGMSKAKVFLMIMLETVMLSLTGGIVGLTLSWIIIELTNKRGINLSSVAEGLNSVGYSSFVRPELEMNYYLMIVSLVVITAIMASIMPARKALKLKPSEAVRQDV